MEYRVEFEDNIADAAGALNAYAADGWELASLVPWRAVGCALILRRGEMPPRPELPRETRGRKKAVPSD